MKMGGGDILRVYKVVIEVKVGWKTREGGDANE